MAARVQASIEDTGAKVEPEERPQAVCGGHPRRQAALVREARRRRMLSAKPEEMGGRLLHLGAASPSRDARRMRQEDGLAESRMATAALPVTGSDAGGYRDA